jgi:hypothetical protein
MSQEYYHPDVTERSWQTLIRLREEFPFTLIGGWAAWCYTQGPKSRDIDIVVNYSTLGALRAHYGLVKNERLRKYEVPLDGFDLDIYVEHYSTTLTVPPERLLTETTSVQGFTVPPVEALLALKLGAWLDRRASIHGEKDLADIRGLLPMVDRERWVALPDEYGLSETQARRLHEAWANLARYVPRRMREQVGLPEPGPSRRPGGPRL